MKSLSIWIALACLCLSLGTSLAQEADAPKATTGAEVEKDADVAETPGGVKSEEKGHADPADHPDGHATEGKGDAASGHADELHLENDPTHGNISPPTWELIEFRTDMAFFSAIVFLLLLAGLTAVAWKPIMEGLEKRERGIADNIARAEKAANDATAKLAEYEAKLAGANEESQRILAEARKDAEAAGQKMIAAAQEEAANQRDRAVADIDAAKRVALSELASQSTDVAMSLAQRVVGREVKAADHQGLIQEMLSKVPSKN
ncbi:MAG: F0F1 ATP synthase subunit B [Pirellulaceae bacterium]